jgi:hypothetical protein
MKCALSLTLVASLAAQASLSDWSRVRAIAPGEVISLRATGAPDEDHVVFVSATDDEVTVLLFAARIPRDARQDPAGFAAAHPQAVAAVARPDVVQISREIRVHAPPSPGALHAMGAMVAAVTVGLLYAVVATCKDECSDKLLGGIAIGVPAAAAVVTVVRSHRQQTEIIYRAP